MPEVTATPVRTACAFLPEMIRFTREWWGCPRVPPVTPGFVLMQQLPGPLVPTEKGKEENRVVSRPCPRAGAGGLWWDPGEGQPHVG